jgi:hypothetical protein
MSGERGVEMTQDEAQKEYDKALEDFARDVVQELRRTTR